MHARFVPGFVPTLSLCAAAAVLCALFLSGFSAPGVDLFAAADAVLPVAALVSLLLCAVFCLLPRARRRIPAENGEPLPFGLWFLLLCSLFFAGNLPLFLLEDLAHSVTGAPSSLPGPLTFVFPALLTLCVCAGGAGCPFFRGLAAVSALCAVTALLHRAAPVATEAFALVPVAKGAVVPVWVWPLAAAAAAALLSLRKKDAQAKDGAPLYGAALFGAFALFFMFVTAGGVGPLLRAVPETAIAFVRSFSGMLSGGGRTLAYWLCLSPAMALAAVRLSRGKSPAQAVIGMFLAGLFSTLLLHLVFGAFGGRLLKSAADAGFSGLSAGETPAQSVALLTQSLPFPAMDAFLLVLSMLLISSAAVCLALTPLFPKHSLFSLLLGAVCALPAFAALLMGADAQLLVLPGVLAALLSPVPLFLSARRRKQK